MRITAYYIIFNLVLMVWSVNLLAQAGTSTSDTIIETTDNSWDESTSTGTEGMETSEASWNDSTTAVAENAKATEIPTMKLVATVEDKTYYAEYEPKRNWSEAYRRCRSLGYKLASVTSVGQKIVLRNSRSSDFNKDYWTSGRDAGTLEQFVWHDTLQEMKPFYRLRISGPVTCVNLNMYRMSDVHFVARGCHHTLGTLCESGLSSVGKTVKENPA